MKKVLLIALSVIFVNLQAKTPEDYKYPGFPTPAQYWIQKALDSSGSCELLPHTYPVTGTIILKDNNSISGAGTASKLGTLYDIVLLDVQGNNVTIKDLFLYGFGGANDQIGIKIQGNESYNRYGNKITNVVFDQFKTAGLYVYHNTSALQGTVTLLNCTARGCGVGFWCDTRGEYCTFVACSANQCESGFRNKGGNNSLIGGVYSLNTIGIELLGGENDGHCIADGVLINHNNSYAVKAVGLQNGYEFSSCPINYGKIKLVNSPGIRFNDCPIYTTDSIHTNSSTCYFKGCIFSVTPSVFSGFSFIDCRFSISLPGAYFEELNTPALRSANGTIYKIKVENDGTLTTY